MDNTLTLDEDLRLKEMAAQPADQAPQVEWHAVVSSHADADSGSVYHTGKIANIIGQALTDLLLSRDEDQIDTDSNRRFVANLALAVGKQLQALVHTDRDVSDELVIGLIERALIENDAHDVARSLMFRCSAQLAGQQGCNPVTGVKLIRRNGQVVPWIESKIEIAVRKAFLSSKMDSRPAVEVAQAVSERVRSGNHHYISIEDVQDLVQEELMRKGHYKVAENFILYRARRSRMRTAESDSSAAQRVADAAAVTLHIRMPDGESVVWDGTDLRKRIDFGLIDLNVEHDRAWIENELRRSLFDHMTQDDLRNTVILNAKALMELDASYAKFAGRILLTYCYEESLDWDIVRDGVDALRDAHRTQFARYLRRAVAIERLRPELLEYDLDEVAAALDPSADLDFDYLGLHTLYDRYLLVDKTGGRPKRMETPQFFWMRVSMGLFLKDDPREAWAIRLYNLYKSRRFCSSTPTLFNSGTMHSQLSSCYLYKVDDSIESIMQRGIADNAYLSKWAGGLGGSWTAVRGTGSRIQGTNGESQGVIPFLKLHNDQLVAVNQGGKRRGSGCAYLETWHSDLLDFLELRRNTGDDRRRTHDMNTANWIPDLFMKRMEGRGDWTFFRSNEVKSLHELYGKAFEEEYVRCEERARQGEIFGKTVPAIDVWKVMLKMLFETGHPWITFKDPCNVRSPQDHAGVIHSSNLCTEITLNTSHEETAVCNLGSIILDNHLMPDGSLDHDRLRETISIAVRALDNVIDINFYPTESARTANMRHRPVGLGVMGLQDALYRKGIPFASEEAVEFNDEFMEAIAFHAYEASSDLAAERGPYSSYEGSKWSRGLLPQDTLDLLEAERGEAIDVPRGGQLNWEPLRAKIARQGMRNSNVLAIAPTATISNIMGTTPCIEPNYKNLYVKSNLGGEFIVLNRGLVKDLKQRGLWTRDMIDQLKYFDGELEVVETIPDDVKALHKTVFSIPYEFIIDAAARRQKWIDQSQSVNLFLAEPDLKVLSHMYRRAWCKGLKTTYYLRTLGASNIEKASVQVKKEKRGIMGGVAAPAAGVVETEAPKKTYTDEEVRACSLDAMLNGEECEACQ